MTMTKERFEKGLTYDAFKSGMSRNRERVEDNERKVALDAETLRFFTGLPKPVNVVVLAEDWCGDVIANLDRCQLRRGSARLPGSRAVFMVIADSIATC